MLLESRGLTGRKRNGLTLTSFGDGGGGGGGGGGGAGGAGSEEDDEESRHHLYLGRKMQGEGTAAPAPAKFLRNEWDVSWCREIKYGDNLLDGVKYVVVNTRGPGEARPEKKPVVHRVSARPGEVSHRNSGNGRGRSPGPSPDVRTRPDGVRFHHRVSWTPAANNRPRRSYAARNLRSDSLQFTHGNGPPFPNKLRQTAA
ncbi:Uncharacterized protein DBV15_00884 [Temnothorax longispinosus]|uniref:Uncharacterized protein n=1 Tax=Temnothorax longispinosus TaxID=300112 RepID=A0A4S2JBB1_9HYME|nr:Uncharacterized protein DBV15_00884 [Temnothorax longispinosus]